MGSNESQDMNDRELFVSNRAEARNHGYVGLFIIGTLLFLLSIALLAAGGSYSTISLIAWGVVLLIVSILIFISAGRFKSNHDAAREFVLEWYKLHPEDNPEIARVVVQGTQSNWADDLRELKKLLDEGIITQEEYEKKKQDILSK